jgi:hypothetical protein
MSTAYPSAQVPNGILVSRLLGRGTRAKTESSEPNLDPAQKII